MAVIVKYVVVRDGKEDMIFTTKKEADAYDRMLDIAERLWAFLRTSEVDIDPDKLDALTFFMAQHGDQISRLLKGGALDAPSDHTKFAIPPADHAEIFEGTEAGESAVTDTPKSARATRSKALA